MEPCLADLLARVVRYWHHALLNSPAARDTLAILMGRMCPGGPGGPPLAAGPGRGDACVAPTRVGVPDLPCIQPDAALIERFVIGFVDGTLRQIVPAKGEVVEQLRVLGILDGGERAGPSGRHRSAAPPLDARERFVGCITIPVFDEREQVVQVAFEPRCLSEGDLAARRILSPSLSLRMNSRSERTCTFQESVPGVTWLFDETPTWWNAACLKHARNIAIVRDPLAGLAAMEGRHSGVARTDAADELRAGRETRPSILAPAGPGIPLGQGAKDLLVLHAPRVTIVADDAAWSEAMAREIEPLGVAVDIAVGGALSGVGGTIGPDDATPRVASDARSHTSGPLPAARTPPMANDKSQITNNKFRSPATRIVSQDANGFTVEFPRRIRFVVQGIVQDSPRHLRASVKALRRVGAVSTPRPDAEAAADRDPKVAPTRIHLDTLDLYHARSRIGFAKTAACLLGEDPAVMEEHMAQVVALAEEFLKKTDAPAATVILTDSEKAEAMEFLCDPRLMDRVLADLATLGYVGEETNKLVSYVAAVSRKLEDALSVLVVSRSGAGKSTLAEAVGMLAPEEDVLRLTRLTPQTLYYQKHDALAHKLVLIEEAEGVEEAAYALRVLQSARHLSLSTAAGRGESQTREVKGPVALFMTTTRTDVDEETASRFLIIAADESAEQTRRILEAQRASEAKPPSEKAHILRIHRNAQRLLRPLAVINPFALQLTFPHERLSARRDHKRYLGLIRAVALLHQHQRKIEEESVVVEVADIEIANQLANEALGQSIYDLTAPSRRLLVEIREWLVERAGKEGVKIEEVKISQRELRDRIGWRKSQLAGHVKELVEAEYLVTHHESGRGRRTRYALDWDGQGMDGEKFFKGLTPATRLISSDSSGSRPGHFQNTSTKSEASQPPRRKRTIAKSATPEPIRGERRA